MNYLNSQSFGQVINELSEYKAPGKERLSVTEKKCYDSASQTHVFLYVPTLKPKTKFYERETIDCTEAVVQFFENHQHLILPAHLPILYQFVPKIRKSNRPELLQRFTGLFKPRLNAQKTYNRLVTLANAEKQKLLADGVKQLDQMRQNVEAQLKDSLQKLEDRIKLEHARSHNDYFFLMGEVQKVFEDAEQKTTEADLIKLEAKNKAAEIEKKAARRAKKLYDKTIQAAEKEKDSILEQANTKARAITRCAQSNKESLEREIEKLEELRKKTQKMFDTVILLADQEFIELPFILFQKCKYFTCSSRNLMKKPQALETYFAQPSVSSKSKLFELVNSDKSYLKHAFDLSLFEKPLFELFVSYLDGETTPEKIKERSIVEIIGLYYIADYVLYAEGHNVFLDILREKLGLGNVWEFLENLITTDCNNHLTALVYNFMAAGFGNVSKEIHKLELEQLIYVLNNPFLMLLDPPTADRNKYDWLFSRIQGWLTWKGYKTLTQIRPIVNQKVNGVSLVDLLSQDLMLKENNIWILKRWRFPSPTAAQSLAPNQI